MDFDEDVEKCMQTDLLLDAFKNNERGNKVDEDIEFIPFSKW